MNEYTQKILRESATARQHAVMDYQINIDNYTLAIKEIDENHGDDMKEFRIRLEALLKTELLEQKKEMIMLKVITQQLEG
jgi:ribosomal protein L14E/L6E/L27E